MRNNCNHVCLFVTLIMTSCTLGPDYKTPEIIVPNQFQETGIDWQIINPDDEIYAENWWQVFKDPTLDKLEEKLKLHNNNVIAAQASYKAAKALVDKTSIISYLPSVNVASAIARQGQIGPSLTGTSAKQTNIPITVTHALPISGTWTPDIWGGVGRTVESAIASADSAKANMALIMLNSQASLAQYYFELRISDKDQVMLDKIVDEYQTVLTYGKNRYATGIAGEQDIAQADQQLQIAKTQAINNKIARAQYQHAIAVLIGEAPSTFNLPAEPDVNVQEVSVPITVPSTVLKHRPDVAYAAYQVAIASANIGIIKSAFFPSFTLSGSATYQGKGGLNSLFSLPTLVWSVGPQLAFNLTNLAAYQKATEAAKEDYNASVATYRQTVLAALQDVEDNMVALRILREQKVMQEIATNKAKATLDITINQYKAGTIDQSQLSTSQIAYYTAEKSLNDLKMSITTTSIALMRAIGSRGNI